VQVRVALPIALEPLTYLVPVELVDKITIGSAVKVPLRKKIQTGYVCALDNSNTPSPGYELKNVIEFDLEQPPLSESLIKFLTWISEYYLYPMGEVIEAALAYLSPSKQIQHYTLAPFAWDRAEEERKTLSQRGGKRLKLLEILNEAGSLDAIPEELKGASRWLIENEFVLKTSKEKSPEFLQFASFPESTDRHSLRAEQASAFEEIRLAIDSNAYSAFLLHGVTGSGKTEVYLAATEYCLSRGKSAMILVPEIALTPQLSSRFRARLGEKIAVFHSALNDSERSDQWRLVDRGLAKVVLGARSSIFAPLKNIGLVIVDEEHEPSFKQEDRLKYNARDMALLRGQFEKATVVLGSATPSLETFHLAIRGKIKRLVLSERHSPHPSPKMEVVDLRREKLSGAISGRLLLQIKRVYESGKQSVLFLNRRGFSSFIVCKSCGDVPECPNCSVSLTHYRRNNSMQCHYCGFEVKTPSSCVKCGSDEFSFGGLGTESLELEIQAALPEARLLRIDRESTQKKGSLETKLHAIARGECDIVIGTQMIAKGHDFPNVALAAIVNADVSLNVPDFRAAERAHQLFTQVAGRAGRAGTIGTVVLQTYSPDHPSIRHAKTGAFEDFCREELELRQSFHYPPFFRLARILVTNASDLNSRKAAEAISKLVRSYPLEGIEILGPAPAVIHKILNKYRWNILLKAKTATSLNSLLKSLVPSCRALSRAGGHISIDVDPVSLL
jgi:primosomal protein N' (replication factor Y)